VGLAPGVARGGLTSEVEVVDYLGHERRPIVPDGLRSPPVVRDVASGR
jgi:hypothetical protein